MCGQCTEIKTRLVDTPVTLNGQPAKVSGRLNDFATVGTLDPTGPTVEFAWATVAHIVNNKNGEFRT